MTEKERLRDKYEVLKQDNDGQYYYFTRDDFDSPFENDKLAEFLEWWSHSEINDGLYYKGTRLYFSLDDKKYYLTWTFYNVGRLELASEMLKTLGAYDIAINYGELD